MFRIKVTHFHNILHDSNHPSIGSTSTAIVIGKCLFYHYITQHDIYFNLSIFSFIYIYSSSLEI